MAEIGTNTGHGHVWERPDGMKARCGGPAMCSECAKDQANWQGNSTPSPTAALTPEQLKPCPFCGGHANGVYWSPSGARNGQLHQDRVQCLDCWVTVHGQPPSLGKSALEVWNTRAPAATADVAGLVERLRKFGPVESYGIQSWPRLNGMVVGEIAQQAADTIAALSEKVGEMERRCAYLYGRIQEEEQRADTARADAYEEAALIVEGFSTAENYLPENVDGGWLAIRDLDMGRRIRALKPVEEREG